MADKVGEFEVISDNGKRYIVYEWKERIYTDNLSSKTKTYIHAKLSNLRTSEGYDVSPIGKDKYHIIDIDIICTKIQKTK